MLQFRYKYKNYFTENEYATNIFVALYTTAQARLRLYSELSGLDKAVLYCDTDSIIYENNGENHVKTGDLLGEWTDELGGSYIEKFLSTGPKSYYFRTSEGQETTKVKGFTINHLVSQKINGSTMEDLIDKSVENVEILYDNQITRDPATKQLVNKNQIKTLNFNFDKRVICYNFDTVPYGY